MNITHNRPSPPRWRAAYQTCTTCGFQFWQEKQEQQRCNLCSTSLAMPRAKGQEQLATARAEKERVAAQNPSACAHCGDTFISANPRQLYCSIKCQRAQTYQRSKQSTEYHRECAGGCGATFVTTYPQKVTCGSARCRDRVKQAQKKEREEERRKLAAMMAAASARKEQAA